MKDMIKIADDVKALRRMFDGVIALADVVEEIGQIEQAKHNATVELMAKKAEIEQLKAEVVKLNDQADFARGEIDEAHKKATAVFSEGQADADHLRSVARAEADKIIAAAHESEAVIAQSIAEKQKEFNVVADMVTREMEALQALKKKIEETKAEFRKIVD